MTWKSPGGWKLADLAGRISYSRTSLILHENTHEPVQLREVKRNTERAIAPRGTKCKINIFGKAACGTTEKHETMAYKPLLFDRNQEEPSMHNEVLLLWELKWEQSISNLNYATTIERGTRLTIRSRRNAWHRTKQALVRLPGTYARCCVEYQGERN